MSNAGVPNLAGAYGGERLFLIGNGPSLGETPLDMLKDEYTMAMNKIDLIYHTVAWRPDFYVCVRQKPMIQGPLRNSLDVHIEMDSVQIFVSEAQQNHVQPAKQINYITMDNLLQRDRTVLNLSMAEIQDADIKWLEQFWSYDPRKIVYNLHTMYIAVQLAMWMGFDEIYLLGADLDYGTNKHMLVNNSLDPIDYGGDPISYFHQAWEAGTLPSAIINGFALKLMDLLMRSEFLMQFTDYSNNHFDNSYFNVIQPARLGDELLKAHLVTKRICESNGLDVFNATLGGELEVYPRVNLEDIL
jgi:hypothetical protein